MIKGQPILLVEDEVVDQLSVKRAMRELDIPHPLMIAENGEEAIEILVSEDEELPCLIILDMNMPRMNGVELLRALKGNDDIINIPIIMLTTSKDTIDIKQTYELGVKGYMIKPRNYKDYIQVISSIYNYWSKSITLPN